MIGRQSIAIVYLLVVQEVAFLFLKIIIYMFIITLNTFPHKTDLSYLK